VDEQKAASLIVLRNTEEEEEEEEEKEEEKEEEMVDPLQKAQLLSLAVLKPARTHCIYPSGSIGLRSASDSERNQGSGWNSPTKYDMICIHGNLQNSPSFP